MSRSSVKKRKRLKKGHIWPSVVFLLIAMVLSFVVFSAFTSIILTYFAQDRLRAIYDNAESVVRSFSDSPNAENDSMLMAYLENYADFTDAVYLLDADGEVLSGFGGATYDLNRAETITGISNLAIYADNSTGRSIFLDGEIDVDRLQLVKIKVDNIASAFQVLSFSRKSVVYEEVFWLGAALSGQRTVLMKGRIGLYDGDIFLAAVIGILSFAVMLLPILFLFVNVVSTVVKQSHMTKLLYTNPVTNGNSWTYFEQYADKTFSKRGNANKLFAVVDITIMKYRSYCSYHGIEAGEKLLEKVDKQIALWVRNSGCSALYGKSSYGLLLKCKSREDVERQLNNLLKRLDDSLEHGGMAFHAGICFVEPLTDEKGRVLRRKDVDVADYFNQAGAARASITDENVSAAAVFDQKLMDEQIWEHRVSEKMQKALENEEFQVYIQPKYNPVTEQLAGAEALVRWINQEDGFISPGRFIPIFEKNGFITKLDDYMISHVAKLQAQWLAKGKEVVPVSVNISRAHFANPDLAKHICELVDQYQVPHRLIEIELTESAFFDDKAALLSTVQKLKEAGFDVSMDDFGAGYSSLNSLKDLPLDVLKLDADFFRGEDGEGRGEIVVSQAIRLAKQLNMRIVAEGVEKKDQVDFLAAHDCGMIQGFYFAKPMPAVEYEEKLGEKQ